jgi:hypothetical protein
MARIPRWSGGRKTGKGGKCAQEWRCYVVMHKRCAQEFSFLLRTGGAVFSGAGGGGERDGDACGALTLPCVRVHSKTWHKAVRRSTP